MWPTVVRQPEQYIIMNSRLSSLLYQNFDFILVCLACFLVAYFVMRRRTNLPPGPFFSLPFLGNVLHLIGKDPREVFNDMRTKYGDVFSLNILGNELMVVLNGYSAVREALLKKGRYFSDRPNNFLTHQLFKNQGIAFASGKSWLEQKTFAMHTLKQNAFTKDNLEQIILGEMEFFNDVLTSNSGKILNLTKYLKLCAFNITTKAIANTRYDYNDPSVNSYIHDMDTFLDIMGVTGPLANSFPILKYFPGDPLQMKVIEGNCARRRAFVAEIYDKHLNEAGEDNPNDFIHLYISEIRRSGEESTFTKEQLLYILEVVHTAGMDTTSSTIGWALWYLKENLDVQKKVQAEISTVLGPNRRPTLKDQSRMPYVEATITEVMRIATVVPFSVPHATNEDVIFKGYNIPKGTLIIPNVHSVHTDPKTWGDPTEFRPERFLNDDGSVRRRNEFMPFGVGKRICLGEVLGRAQLFLIITWMYQRFSFLHPSKSMPGVNEGILGFSFNPKPFNVELVSRSLVDVNIVK